VHTKETKTNIRDMKLLNNLKRLIIITTFVFTWSLLSSCNKYELLEGCTYRNDIGASKPVELKIGNQKQTVFIADATYYLPEGTKIHFKALHNDTEVRINDRRFTLKRKGDEVWYITKNTFDYVTELGK